MAFLIAFQLQRYSDCMSGALTRDPDLPEKGQGEITMDDQIMKLRLSPQEKDDCTAVFQVVLIKANRRNIFLHCLMI